MENVNKQLLHPCGVASHYSLIRLKMGEVCFFIHPLFAKSHKPSKDKRGEEDRRAI